MMLKVFLVLCCVFNWFILILGFFHPIKAINEDLGRHLLLGKIITQSHQVPQTNLLSYTYPEYPFVNSHWLSEVVFYQVVQAGGYNVLLLFTIFITCITFLPLFVFTLKKYSLAASALATTLLMPVLIRRSDIRPELFSFLFESLFLWILFNNRLRPTKWIYLLIPLEIIWVNMHIYFVAGIIIITAFFLESLIKNTFHITQSTKRLAIVLFFTSLATVINPNGFKGALFPFTVFSNYGLSVLENQSVFSITNFSHLTQILYGLFMIGLVILLLFLNRKKTTMSEWFLVVVFSLLSFAAIRNFPLFAYAAFLPLTAALYFLLPRFATVVSKKISSTFSKALQVFIFFMVIILVGITHSTIIRPVGFGVPEKYTSAANFFLEKNLHGPIYNDYNSGSYYAYRFYPKERVFVEGRPEAYPKEFFTDVYMPMQTDSGLFTKINNLYKFNTIFISDWQYNNYAATLIKEMLGNTEYRLVYIDENELIFIRRVSQHEKVIADYGITETSFRTSSPEKKVLLERLFSLTKSS